ncbi:uncharacterized protein [Montipora foliosa]|uniref:uncharacterized protein n=1 Tax=Montipora foliosa TaxID=591990 RepID=UPI0035F11D5C
MDCSMKCFQRSTHVRYVIITRIDVLKMKNLFSNPLFIAAVIDFSIQWALWLVASFLQTETFLDLAGSSTFILLTWHSIRKTGRFHVRQLIQSGCVTLWGLRLGMYLFHRILNDGKDARFDKVRGNPIIFLIYWTLQGVWVWITLWPTLVLNTTAKDERLTWKDYFGWSLWLIGFLLEATADRQKSQFLADPANKEKWISTGLWSLSQHPNYLGEILMWSSLFLPASSVMSGYQYWSAISPLFVAYLLIRVSGIPIVEKRGLKKWGHLARYQMYRQNTAKLIPYIW